MKKRVNLNPKVQLRMFFKGAVYKVYSESDDSFYVEGTNVNEEQLKEFLDNLVKMRFINSYELLEEVSNAEQSTAEQTTTEQPTTEQATAEQPTTEQATTETSSTESTSESQPSTSRRRKKSSN